MNRLSIDVDDILLVLSAYDKIKVYRGNAEGGPFVEITDSSTRINLVPSSTTYWFTDPVGNTTHWYVTSYYNSSTDAESSQSSAIQGGVSPARVGWTFGNYAPPPGEWGDVLTPADLRYTWFFGIDPVGSNANAEEWTDEQYRYHINAALADWERWLKIDIRKRVYKTKPVGLTRSKLWRAGVDYTDEDDSYLFEPSMWSNYGFLQLRHWPVLSIERLKMYNPLGTEILDLQAREWVRITKKFGQVHLYPSASWNYGPLNAALMPLRYLNRRYPDAFQVDYTTGYETAEFVPEDLRQMIGMMAAIRCLDAIGDGLLAGFSSQNISLDGLGESFSSTQSATSAYFGARIESMTKQMKEWLPKVRYSYGPIPVGFVGKD